MKIANILKVADIDSNELTPVFIAWLGKETTPVYSDNEGLNEHLFNIDTVIENQEEAEGDGPEQNIWDILHEIKALLHENDCGYFRIIY